jgi:hypothetical protein
MAHEDDNNQQQAIPCRHCSQRFYDLGASIRHLLTDHGDTHGGNMSPRDIDLAVDGWHKPKS